MGTKLIKEYEKAKQLGGLKAQMRLAILTKISGPKAAILPDSPENLSCFECAMKEILKDFRTQQVIL
jgi:hypothetical protein